MKSILTIHTASSSVCRELEQSLFRRIQTNSTEVITTYVWDTINPEVSGDVGDKVWNIVVDQLNEI